MQNKKNDFTISTKKESFYPDFKDQITFIESIDFLSNIFQMPHKNLIPMICKTDAMFQIIESLKFVRERFCEMENSMEKIPMKNQSFTSTRNQMTEMVKESKTIEKMASNSMEPSEALTGISNYYSMLSEMETNSRTFADLVREFSPISSEIEKESDKTPGLWDSVMRIASSIKDKIKIIKDRITTIIEKIKGAVSETGRLLLSELDAISDFISNSVKAGITKVTDLKNVIINSLNSASRKFQEFILKLIETMFDFLSKFGDLAKNKGFPVSSVEIKAPTIKYEFMTIIGFSIPIPKIDPPEMTITLSPQNKS
jgi:hypothetical protein